MITSMPPGHAKPVHFFCATVTMTLSCILGCRIQHLSLCLLGDTSHTDIPIKDRHPLLVSLTIAKKTFFLNWKSKLSLRINHWTILLNEFISAEKCFIQEQYISLQQNLEPFSHFPQLKMFPSLEWNPCTSPQAH